jgi:regulator of protease activity HflC (stomatin/prohibitin superfamily)
VHTFFGLNYSIGSTHRVAEEGDAIINGTKAILIVKQGHVGLAMDRGEPIILPPGIHQWDDPNLNFERYIDLTKSILNMGPYTLVTVEESYAAITQDNGKQKVLAGGSSYMLTHQNWQFQAWLSLKMQTNKLGPFSVTTGDNIALNIVANVNWVITDAVVAAGKNVDSSLGTDTLKLMREDVNLQVTSSLASLVGSISYGSKGTSGIQHAARKGKAVSTDEEGDASAAEPEPETKLDRKALWDPERLQSAVNDANLICNRYGVDILSINLISAAPADKNLQEIMSRGAVATVSAEETTKAARAEANAALITAQAEAQKAQATADAMLIKARSEAEAMEISAKADAEAERIRAQGAKDAGKLMGESDVAVSLAKLKIAYGPFQENQSNTYFFGLQGPGELPTAILGNHLANETGATGLALATTGRSRQRTSC